MKICIDARMYGLEHAGIGRYVANLIREIKNQKSKLKNIKITLLVRKKNLGEINREFSDTFEIVICDASHYSFREQIFLPLQLIKLKPDLAHFPHFNVPVFWWGRQVVTIHDLIKHTSRGMETTTRTPWLYWFKYLGYKIVFSHAVKRAKKILAPSKWVKKELIRAYKIPEEKIIVTYEGIDSAFRIKNLQHREHRNLLKAQRVLNKYKIKKPFVIYTGSLYPHKNIERLIQAIKLLITNYQLPITLVISCARSVFWGRLEKRIKELDAEKYVNLVGFVPDEELVLLYQQAEAFVFPTLAEGFGLPGLEAMACGCPVVCSDIPVLREVYEEAAVFFDPSDTNDITQKISKACCCAIKKVCSNDSNHRNEMIKRGLEQVKKYSWQKMAQQTLKAYQEAMLT